MQKHKHKINNIIQLIAPVINNDIGVDQNLFETIAQPFKQILETFKITASACKMSTKQFDKLLNEMNFDDTVLKVIRSTNNKAKF